MIEFESQLCSGLRNDQASSVIGVLLHCEVCMNSEAKRTNQILAKLGRFVGIINREKEP